MDFMNYSTGLFLGSILLISSIIITRQNKIVAMILAGISISLIVICNVGIGTEINESRFAESFRGNIEDIEPRVKDGEWIRTVPLEVVLVIENGKIVRVEPVSKQAKP